MGEFLAPVIEGFFDASSSELLSQLQGMVKASAGSSINPTAFLKQMLLDKRDTADSLMNTAKKISPASEKISALETAYDAAFESDESIPIPNSSATLQGFTLIFFMISFLSLAIVSSTWVSNLTGDTSSALKTFGLFFGAFLLSIGLITRFG
jgi:hypothetical protein